MKGRDSSQNEGPQPPGLSSLTVAIPESLKREPAPAKAADPELDKLELVFVHKWVDYSSKYGLGYLLSNDIVGLHFNDNTKMLAVRDSQ